MTFELLILQLFNIAGLILNSWFLAIAEDRWETLASIFALLCFSASLAITLVRTYLGG